MTQTTFSGGNTADHDDFDTSQNTVKTLSKDEYARTADRLQLNGLMQGVNITGRYP
jgi:hypothetical protein